MRTTIHCGVAIAVAVGLAACSSSEEPAPSASGSSSTSSSSPPSSTAAPSPAAQPSGSGAQPSPSSAPDCVGLSICTPPPPDAQGNPPCFYSDGWQPTGSAPGIEAWYFTEPQNMSKPNKVTAVVRKKDGTEVSDSADIEAGQQVHRFEFPTVDQATVEEVFFDTAQGRCFVIGPTTGETVGN